MSTLRALTCIPLLAETARRDSRKADARGGAKREAGRAKPQLKFGETLRRSKKRWIYPKNHRGPGILGPRRPCHNHACRLSNLGWAPQVPRARPQTTETYSPCTFSTIPTPRLS